MQDVSSERLVKASEIELMKILKTYKEEHFPLWKYGVFAAYNALAMIGIFFYGKKLRGPTVPSTKIVTVHHLRRFDLVNVFRSGSKHGVFISALYIGGFIGTLSQITSFTELKKLTEIQATLGSMGLRFDSTYQERVLFSRLRKFDYSEQLIEQIKADIHSQKQRFIDSKGFTPQTLAKIQESEQYFQKNKEKFNRM